MSIVAPQPHEYDEAVQNPRFCFTDPELRGGVVETYPPGRGIPGMPWPRSGAFGQAYRVVSSGGQPWAVKCFTRLHDDQETRYRAISQHLKRANLPYMVDFDFQPAGMRVKGQSYPLLKMAWVEGAPLDDFIEKHLHERDALERLGNQWLALIERLETEGIAHGDLQHGNILVANGELRLIDYDGMYVPALRGRPSHELGHRNYQHPQRTEQHFAPGLDRFSAWVIYLSLLALREEPELWARFGGGDEKLIFEADDLKAPGRSALLQTLSHSPKPQLRPLAAFMHDLVRLPPTSVTSLDGNLVRQAMVQAGASWIREMAGQPASTGPSLTAALPPASPQPAHQPPAALAPAQTAASQPVSQPPPLVKLPPKPWLPQALWPIRLGLALQLLTSAVIGYLASLGLLMSEIAVLWFASTLAITAVLVSYRYVTLDAFRKRSDLLTERAHLRGTQRRAAKRLRTLETQWQREERHGQVNLQRLLEMETERRDRQARAIKAAAEELRQQEEAQLERLRQRKLREGLARVRLAQESIPNIGPLTLLRLAKAGVLTAADVDSVRVRGTAGVGEQRAQSLLAWRRQVEMRLQPTLPTTLPADQAAVLQRQAQRKREQIELRHRKPLAGASEKRQQAEQRLADQAQRALTAIGDARRQQGDLAQNLLQVESELTAYETLRFVTFLRRLFFLRG